MAGAGDGLSRTAPLNLCAAGADDDPMTVFAHVGHWYHSVLYFAPLLVLFVLVVLGSRRTDGVPGSA